jgi:hypothetical protein
MPIEQESRLKAQALGDVSGLARAYVKYGDSWRKRGGGEAYHNLTRKWDRIERAVEALPSQDLFEAIRLNVSSDGTILGKDGLLDDIRDLRRYLLLAEEYVTRGCNAAPAT